MRTREYRRERSTTKYISKLKKLFKSGVRWTWINRRRHSINDMKEAETYELLGNPANRLYRYKSTRTIWRRDGYEKDLSERKQKMAKQAMLEQIKEYEEQEANPSLSVESWNESEGSV